MSGLYKAIINGVPFTGTIVTVGTGKDYTTLEAAYAATNTDSLFLVYPGTYGANINGDSYNRFIKGMGTSYSDVTLTGILNNYLATGNFFIENVYFNGSAHINTGGTGNILYSKCNLYNEIDYYGPTSYLTLTNCKKDNYLDPVWGKQIYFGSGDASKIIVHRCLSATLPGSGYIEKDYKTVATEDYGPDYGDDLIILTELVSIIILPLNQSIAVGGTQQYQATGIYVDGSTADLTSIVTWDSSNKSAATIDSSGLAAGVWIGNTIISATIGSYKVSTALYVPPAAVVPTTVPQTIVEFSNVKDKYRTATYLTRRYKFGLSSIGAIKVLALKYPVDIDVVYPKIPFTFTITVNDRKPTRIKSFLVDSCEIRINPLAEVSKVYLASTVEEIP